jgi:hypothetical protein
MQKTPKSTFLYKNDEKKRGWRVIFFFGKQMIGFHKKSPKSTKKNTAIFLISQLHCVFLKSQNVS